jgi:outer membrane immunogenic protein
MTTQSPSLACVLAMCAGIAMASPLSAQGHSGWGGFYAGLSIGSAKSEVDFRAIPNDFFFNSGVAADAIAGTFIANNSPANLSASGLTGGGQVGYNWEHGRVVVGLEADISFHDLKKRSDRGPFTDAGFTVHRFVQTTEQNLLVTLRPRIGVTFDRFMVYATAGLSIGNFEVEDTIINNNGAWQYQGTDSGTRVGWVLGGGVEMKLFGQWSLKGEYLRSEFANSNFRALHSTLPNLFWVDHSAKMTMDVFRAGINYRF